MNVEFDTNLAALGSSRGSILWLNVVNGLHFEGLLHIEEHMGEDMFCMPYSEHIFKYMEV